VRTTLLSICSALFVFHTVAADPSGGISEREWKRRLSPTKFEIGTPRARIERRLAAKVIGEKVADHGFASLLDVYYELDAHWCAIAAYHLTSGTLVVQPRPIPNTPELRDRLTQAPQPKQ
jgi:hypothetical protein